MIDFIVSTTAFRCTELPGEKCGCLESVVTKSREFGKKLINCHRFLSRQILQFR